MSDEKKNPPPNVVVGVVTWSGEDADDPNGAWMVEGWDVRALLHPYEGQRVRLVVEPPAETRPPWDPEPPIFTVPREVLRFFSVSYRCYLCDKRVYSLMGCWSHMEREHKIDVFNPRDPEPEETTPPSG